MASSDDKIIGISIKNMSAAGGTSNLIALRNGLKNLKKVVSLLRLTLTVILKPTIS